jgi:hypothetical protein
MQFKVNVSEEKKLLVVTVTGKTDIQAAIESVASIIVHPAIQSGYAIVVDLHQVIGAFSVGEMRALASEQHKYRSLYKKNRTVLIVKEKEVQKASIMCMLVRAFGIHMEAYADMASAMRFLDTGQSWG